MPLSNIFIYSQTFSTFLIGVTLMCLGFCYDEWESAFHCTLKKKIIKVSVLLWVFGALSNSDLGIGK